MIILLCVAHAHYSLQKLSMKRLWNAVRTGCWLETRNTYTSA